MESNTSNSSSVLLPSYCSGWSESDMALIAASAFWIEGVAITVVGVFGLLGNALSVSVLAAREMRNAFNHLLIVLAIVDSFLIGFTMLDYSFVRYVHYVYTFGIISM